jgi:hypothetical protein
VLVSRKLGQFDEVLDAGAARGVDESALLAFDVGRGGDEQEDLIDAVEGGFERRRAAADRSGG